MLVAFCAGGGTNNLGPGSSAPSLSGGDTAGQTLEAPIGAEEDPLRDEAELASVALDNNQLFWTEVFAENDLVYQEATLLLFSGATPTACGQGDAGTGPFYCSAYDTAYIDLTFWSELANRFGATGHFAQAYLISHEIAHHMQNKLGISAEVQQEGARNPADRNALSVAQELQADCYAGVWANSVWTDGKAGDPAGIEIDESYIREALDAAEAVGDDKIQLNMTGQINQDTWTHGSAEQRQEWFTRAFESGDPSKCDTFS